MANGPRVLVIEHSPLPGRPGIGQFNDFLLQNQVDFDVVKMYENDSLPPLAQYDGIISGGGPMSVCEIEKPENAFLKQERQYLREAIGRDMPVLGVCLGHQLMADARGGKVSADSMCEYGWLDVSLTSEGLHDPLFAGIPHDFRGFLYHNDAVTALPADVTVLASSRACPHQALRYIGKRAWSIQFHPEFSRSVAETILSSTRATLEAKGVDVDGMIQRGYQAPGVWNQRIFDNFTRVVRDR